MGMHKDFRMVENIFEELDAPGEWFHDAKTSAGTPRGSSARPGQRPGPTTDTTGTEGRAGPPARPQGTLHLIPSRPDGEPGPMPPAAAAAYLSTSVVEVVRLRHLVELRGSRAEPVRFVTFKGFVFRHAARTFMDTREPLLRSDWTIYRGGAVRIEGAEDVALADCEFDQVGGNAVFASGYNRRVAVRGCHIHDAGASGVCFVGDPAAVRDPLFEYGQTHDLAAIDRTPGPKTDDYPADCAVEDCLIRGIGRVERQPAGVQISMARRITVRDCSVYDCARAGINVGDGTWGGHLIEGCDVFDTVLETHDHGSFNSWGRDRYWVSNHRGVSQPAVKADPRLPFLDAMETTVIRASRWRCDHGWDIDLDDGSSNYAIHDNLLLAGGLKFREGYGRRAWNNVIVNNGFHPHVWFEDSGDVFATNIVMRAHAPIGMPAGWGRGVDGNLFATASALEAHRKAGCDAASLAGDPKFIGPASGDCRVGEGSPALSLGFRNFPMDRFGVRKPSLKAIARTPALPAPAAAEEPRASARAPAASVWLGATLHGLEGEEFSAFGVGKEDGGVQLVDVPPGSAAAAAGLRKDDLIQVVNDRKVRGVADLLASLVAAGDAPLRVKLVRHQAPQTVGIDASPFVKVETAGTAEAFASLRLPASPRVAVATSGRTANDPVASLVDGRLARGYGPVYPNGVSDGAYRIDLGAVGAVSAVTSWSFNQGGHRGRQFVTLYGSASPADPGWDVADRARFVPLGTIDTAAAPAAAFTAASLRARSGSTLGRFRWIVWRVHPVTPIGENTAFQELAVEIAGEPGPAAGR
ncbi:MAG: signaling protein [Lentisphaerae bacterium]|nr:signaling protein [Lentisphaerota bacterium]